MRVPDVRVVDLESGIIAMEWIDGDTVRSILGESTSLEGVANPLDQYGIAQGEK